MRFRTKTPWPKWFLWVLVCHGVLNIVLGLHSLSFRRFDSGLGYVLSGALTLSVAVMGYFIPILVYSEMDAACLRLHKFWKRKEIAWPQVTSAGRFGFGTDDVIVRFGHRIEDYGYILTQPADRDEFLAAIRLFAPQAEVEM